MRVEAELVRLLYAQAMPGIVAGLVLSFGLWAALWDSVPHGPLSLFFSAVILANFGRMALVRWYERERMRADGELPIQPWKRRYVAVLTLVGLIAGLGTAGILSYLQSMTSQLLMFAVLAGVAAANLATSVSVLAAFVGFQVCLLAPNIVFFVTRGDATLVSVGLMLLLLGVILAATARRFHQVLRSTVSLSHEKDDLVENLSTARDAAEAATRAKSAFLANTSHEIRTPMTAVVGLASMLRESELKPRQAAMVERIERAARVLLSLFDDMLDITRIERGKLSLHVRPFDIRTVVSDVLAMFQKTSGDKALALRSEVAETVPARLEGDAQRVQQIVTNLVGNGVKFTEQGEVVVRLGYDAHALRLEVTDTGPGMTQQECATVFDRFVQLDDASTRRHGGAGLGLAITRDLTRLMGGEIEVESVRGRGSTFRVTLPMATPGVVDDAPGAVGVPVQARVLLVDDDEMCREVTAEMLRMLGCEVTPAMSGTAALQVFEPKGFDLVLMDCHMPDLDGYETTRRMRASEAEGHTPIVALTGSLVGDVPDKCKAAGMDAWAEKPPGLEELTAVLRRWCAWTE